MLSDEARKARNAYMREYMRQRRKRPDIQEKQRQSNTSYWERKAREMMEGEFCDD